MTLKEKIAETHPDAIKPERDVGIEGCPYSYLETMHAKEKCKTPKYWNHPEKYELTEICIACWNQEWKEEYAE